MNDDAASRRRARGRVVSSLEASEQSNSHLLTQDEADDLTEQQRHGFNCVVCDDHRGEMIPVGFETNGQVFAHDECRS